MAALQDNARDRQATSPVGREGLERDQLGGVAETQGRILALLETMLPALNVLGPEKADAAEQSEAELMRLRGEVDALGSELEASRSEVARLAEALAAQRLEALAFRENARKAQEAAETVGIDAEKFAASHTATLNALELLREEAAELRSELQDAKVQVVRLEGERDVLAARQLASGDESQQDVRELRETISKLESELQDRDQRASALRMDAERHLLEERARLEGEIRERDEQLESSRQDAGRELLGTIERLESELENRDRQLESLRLEGEQALTGKAREMAEMERRLAAAEASGDALRKELEAACAASGLEAQAAQESSREGSGGVFWKWCSAILLAALAVALFALSRDVRQRENAASSPLPQAAAQNSGPQSASLEALRQDVARLDDKSGRLGQESNELLRSVLARLETLLIAPAGLHPQIGQSPTDQPGAVRFSVPFEPGADALTPAQIKTLDSGLKKILAAPRSVVLVVGYADSQPLRGELSKRYEDNTALSRARALSVARALVAGGVSESVVTTSGMGTAKPLPTAGGSQDRGSQRRVDIVCW